MGSPQLVGMLLLDMHDLNIQVRKGGRVLIEAMAVASAPASHPVLPAYLATRLVFHQPVFVKAYVGFRVSGASLSLCRVAGL